MNELMNLLKGLDEETLSNLVSDFYADDGLIDYIDGDGWKDTRDYFLLWDNERETFFPLCLIDNCFCAEGVEGIVKVFCTRDDYCDVEFVPASMDELLANFDDEDREELTLSEDKSSIIIEKNYKLKEKDKDELFLFLFPNVKKQHDYLIVDTMESTNDRFGNEETKEKILNNLCKKLIEKFGTEEKAVEIIKEEVDE